MSERENDLKRKLKGTKLEETLRELEESGAIVRWRRRPILPQDYCQLPPPPSSAKRKFPPHSMRHLVASSFIRDMAERQTQGDAEEKE